MKNMGYNQGDMKAHVESYQKPDSCYAEKYDQAPLKYVERENMREGKQASKIRDQKHKGRY